MPKNVHQKLVPNPFLILVNNTKQPLHARNSFKNKTYILKEDYQKAFKKLTLFFFWIQSLFMDKVIKYKRGLELVTGWSSGYKTSSEKFLY